MGNGKAQGAVVMMALNPGVSSLIKARVFRNIHDVRTLGLMEIREALSWIKQQQLTNIIIEGDVREVNWRINIHNTIERIYSVLRAKLKTPALKESYLYKLDKGVRWVERLLSSEFFGVCSRHSELRKNERNVFCLDCHVELCRHCLKSDSCFHRHVQICKYVYQDVIRLHDIQKYLDCSRIQTYKINGEKAVHLNPRPVVKDAKPSTKAKFGAACKVCGRYLQDLPNRFCSIACKVSGGGSCVLEGQTVSLLTEYGAPITSFNARNDVGGCEYDGSALTETESDGEDQLDGEEDEGTATEWLTPSPLLTGSWRRRSHQRKGVPFRAPFC